MLGNSARHLPLSERLALGIVLLAGLTQAYISLPLWYNTRQVFPMLPWFGAPVLQQNIVLYALIYSVLAAGVLALVFYRQQRLFQVLVASIPLCMLLLVVLDYNRLQPWVYQYSLMISVWLVLQVWPREGLSAAQFWRWLVVLTYFYSGLHKFHPHFQENVFEWLMGILSITQPYATNSWLAISVGVAEMLFALGLLFKLTRFLALIGLSAMHLYILGVLITDWWNPVVWPWNMAMLCLIWLLFPIKTSIEVFPKSVQWYFKAALIIWSLLPMLNIVDKWPATLSFTMYSGRMSDGVFFLHLKDRSFFANPNDDLFRSLGDAEQCYFYLDDLSTKELTVPMITSLAEYRRVGAYFCERLAQDPQAGLQIIHYPFFVKEEQTEMYRCNAAD